MNSKNALTILAVFTMFVGCTTHQRGPAFGHEREFRRQLVESVPVKDWGYKIQDIKFSGNYHKVLVVFAVPGRTNTNELVLEDDGFRRFKGAIRDLQRMSQSKAHDVAVFQAWVTVTLPDE